MGAYLQASMVRPAVASRSVTHPHARAARHWGGRYLKRAPSKKDVALPYPQRQLGP